MTKNSCSFLYTESDLVFTLYLESAKFKKTPIILSTIVQLWNIIIFLYCLICYIYFKIIFLSFYCYLNEHQISN